jgi:uncharacterized protein
MRMNPLSCGGVSMISVLTAGMLLGCASSAGGGQGATADLYQHAKLRPIGSGEVQIREGFWKPIRDRSRDVGVPDYLRKFEAHGFIDNFRYVADGTAKKHHGGPNNNEFVYKHLEAMGIYAAESDAVAKLHEALSETIRSAQSPDGYLNTFYQNPLIVKSGRSPRFGRLNRFELYDFGHYTQAAIAHYRTTGDRKLLDSAIRFANLLVEKFADPADLPYQTYREQINLKYEHPNHELAMVELYRVTGDKRYLDFIRQTLEEYEFFGSKFSEIWGHAVQETLLYAGATDLYLETGEKDVWNVVEHLWADMHDRKRFLTGAVGSQGSGESYGAAYYLPHETCYGETCAGISLVFWNHKMLLATGRGVHADEMERSLYNNVLCGISLDGTHYFYPHPLRHDPKRPVRKDRRPEWYGCSCCPPNLHRLFAALGDYVYTTDDSGIQVNLFVNSSVKCELAEQKVMLVQETDYPWSGGVKLTVKGATDARATIALRIPGWCDGATITVNAQAQARPAAGAYAAIRRAWNHGDVIELDMPMTPRVIPPHPKVKAQQGRIALMVGPVVYCVEQADNPGVKLGRITVAPDVQPRAKSEPDLLGGVVTLTMPAREWADAKTSRPVTIKAIPYYAWANREGGYMNVWLATDKQAALNPTRERPPSPWPPHVKTKPKAPARPKTTKKPTIASTSRVSASFWNEGQRNLALWAVHDQIDPAHSNDRTIMWFHWWPHKGTTEWVQYDFAKAETVSAVEVYWFDDTGTGNCRVPASWRLLYKTPAGQWKPVPAPSGYPCKKDTYNRTTFDAVETTALRLEAKLPPKFSSGILEWKVE